MSEEWRAIPGYEGVYEASDRGRIRSIGRWVTYGGENRPRFARFHDGCVLTPNVVRLDYRRVSLHKDAKSKSFYVHRLVLMAFVGMPELGYEACHRNNDPSDNRLSNLRWDTHKGNMRDAIEAGTHMSAVRRNSTHCKRNHPLSGDNLLMYRGGRNCRACQQIRNRAFREKQRASALREKAVA